MKSEGRNPKPELLAEGHPSKSEIRSPDQRILVCFAVKEEAKAFQKLAGSWPEVRVLVTGMGRRNAEEAICAALTRERPGVVLSCGFAGGLRAELATGDVLFAADAASGLEAALVKAGAQRGRFHCAERVASTAAEKRGLREATGADAVEMESQAICDICRKERIPSAIVRVVLDTASQDLPLDFNLLMTSELRLDYGKLGRALLKSPGKIRALRELQKQSEAAAGQLAQILARVMVA